MKSLASEKRALTAEIKQQTTFVNDLKEMCEKQGNKYRFLFLGDYYTKFSIQQAEAELKQMQENRLELDSKK